MGIFTIYDQANVGFGMEEFNSFGTAVSTANPSITYTLLSSGPGFVNFAINGSPLADSATINFYSPDGFNYRIDSIIYGKAGWIALEMSNLNLYTTAADLASPAVLLNVTLGADTFYGNSFPDLIKSGPGDDEVFGFGGNDTLTGNLGNDLMSGGDGDDYIDASEGLDFIGGGLGRDTLVGGPDADIFYYASAADTRKGGLRDVIYGFERGLDKIDLVDVDANTTKGGNQKFTFIKGTEFSDKAGELLFRKGIIQADTNGDGRVDFEINVGVKVSAGDFYL